jgi:curved DNA-binding protein
MPVDFKDYYATLGVSRDASDDDIKKAFRKLAREYHPDVAKDKKDAEARFKEINEAHEVLSDPEKRKKYDQLGANWKNGAGFEPPGGQDRWGQGSTGAGPQEFHFGGTGFSDFFEQFFGGGGSRFGFDFGENAFNRDQSRQSRGPPRGHDIQGDILVTLDEAMRGSVRSISLQRVDPRTGQGETQTFKVRIPIGVQDGQTIRVPGKGGEGEDGGSPGDLFLRVRFAAHPEFRAKGADLYFELDLAPWEAVLGTTVSVPTLDGVVTVRIPPGSNSGRQLRVRGHGIPHGSNGPRGELYVVINLQLPQELTDEERRLWEQLGQVSRFNARQPAGPARFA